MLTVRASLMAIGALAAAMVAEIGGGANRRVGSAAAIAEGVVWLRSRGSKSLRDLEATWTL